MSNKYRQTTIENLDTMLRKGKYNEKNQYNRLSGIPLGIVHESLDSGGSKSLEILSGSSSPRYNFTLNQGKSQSLIEFQPRISEDIEFESIIRTANELSQHIVVEGIIDDQSKAGRILIIADRIKVNSRNYQSDVS